VFLRLVSLLMLRVLLRLILMSAYLRKTSPLKLFSNAPLGPFSLLKSRVSRVKSHGAQSRLHNTFQDPCKGSEIRQSMSTLNNKADNNNDNDIYDLPDLEESERELSERITNRLITTLPKHRASLQIGHPTLCKLPTHTIQAYKQLVSYLKDHDLTDPSTTEITIDYYCGKGLSTLKSFSNASPNSCIIGIDRSEHRLSSIASSSLPFTSPSSLLSFSHSPSSRSHIIFLRADIPTFIHLLDNYKDFKPANNRIYYPNPYPKSRLYTRRFYGMKCWAVLGEGNMGPVEVRSNWWTLISQVKSSWENFGGKVTVEEVKGTDDAMTHFERKYLKKGVKCWKAMCEIVVENEKKQERVGTNIPRGGHVDEPTTSAYNPRLMVKFEGEEVKGMYVGRKYQHSSDSGWDLHFPSAVTVAAGETKIIDLRISIDARDGEGAETAFWITPRSSIYKTPLRMANSVGLIDKGYRGTLKVVVDNIKGEDYTIEKGERLFQVVGKDLKPWDWESVETLDETERGDGGFGSTGSGVATK